MKFELLGRTAAVAVIAAAMLAGCNKADEKGAPEATRTAGAMAAPAAGATLADQAALGPENDALPRIASPNNASTAKINAALAALDADWKENVAACTDGDKAISREVGVARNAADFLAVTVFYDVSCGGAYPSSGTDAHTYDLTSGALADWSKLLPAAGITNSESTPEYPANTFNSTALQARLVKAAETSAGNDAAWRLDCLPVLQMEGLTLQAAFDPEKPVLNISPGSLPHAVQACGETLALTVDDLKSLGADERLIAAVQAARK